MMDRNGHLLAFYREGGGHCILYIFQEIRSSSLGSTAEAMESFHSNDSECRIHVLGMRCQACPGLGGDVIHRTSSTELVRQAGHPALSSHTLCPALWCGLPEVLTTQAPLSLEHNSERIQMSFRILLYFLL